LLIKNRLCVKAGGFLIVFYLSNTIVGNPLFIVFLRQRAVKKVRQKEMTQTEVAKLFKTKNTRNFNPLACPPASDVKMA
jgi:hypothetical protein